VVNTHFHYDHTDGNQVSHAAKRDVLEEEDRESRRPRSAAAVSRADDAQFDEWIDTLEALKKLPCDLDLPGTRK